VNSSLVVELSVTTPTVATVQEKTESGSEGVGSRENFSGFCNDDPSIKKSPTGR
jgi:hypothetical protein